MSGWDCPDPGKQINQLSGGQKQRIAIARCLIMEPTVLLLDEPLGALDAKLREHMKVELKNLQAQVGTTFVYITHDQSEAMVMSDTVAVMNNGRFEQIGTPQELYHEPKSSFVAQFVGNNNKLRVQVRHDHEGASVARYNDVFDFVLSERIETKSKDEEYDLFVRPESVVINPEKDRKGFHVLPVDVLSILLMRATAGIVRPVDSKDEMVVALPQTREFDHIKAGDRIHIGWDMKNVTCFKRSDWKLYDEE